MAAVHPFTRVETQDSIEYHLVNDKTNETAAIWRCSVESGWRGTSREWRGELRDELENVLEWWDARTKSEAMDKAISATTDESSPS